MRQCFGGGDVPAVVCGVGRIGKNHDVAVGIRQCCELAASERGLSRSMTCVRIDENWRIGLQFCGNIEIEPYIGGICAKVRNLNKLVGSSKNTVQNGERYE